MLRRLYIHNYKCFENFEFLLEGRSPLMIVGQNGVGKSTMAEVLLFLRGLIVPSMRSSTLLLKPNVPDTSAGVPVRFELEIETQGMIFCYGIAYEFDEKIQSFCVLDEIFSVNGSNLISRKKDQITLIRNGTVSTYTLDRKFISIQTLSVVSTSDPVAIFRREVANMLIIKPIPARMGLDYQRLVNPNITTQDCPEWQLLEDCSNFTRWLSHAMSLWPSLYGDILQTLQTFMPDCVGFQFLQLGNGLVEALVQFSKEGSANGKTRNVLFDSLSDGEKCFFVAAAIRSLNCSQMVSPVTCVWDEPDNYLSIKEIDSFMAALCADFYKKGQAIFFSHDEKAIRNFTKDEILVLRRHSHLEPVLKPISLAQFMAQQSEVTDLSNALQSGDLWL